MVSQFSTFGLIGTQLNPMVPAHRRVCDRSSVAVSERVYPGYADLNSKADKILV